MSLAKRVTGQMSEVNTPRFLNQAVGKAGQPGDAGKKFQRSEVGGQMTEDSPSTHSTTLRAGFAQGLAAGSQEVAASLSVISYTL